MSDGSAFERTIEHHPDVADVMELQAKLMRAGEKFMADSLEKVFETKDSGQRQEFSTGMVRDIQTNKPRYDLLDMPLLKRWAELMARGAVKYGENNWKKAATEEELKRFKASAIRHLFQWFDDDVEEDHAAAVCFNLAGAEMVKQKLREIK